MSEPVKDYPPYLDYPKPKKKQTNADRIRAMTDEELGKFLCSESSVLCANCDKSEFCNSGQNGYLVWLKQEADNGNP